MPNLVEALELGLKHHLAGELSRAEEVYRQILAQTPSSDAMNLLGALALQTGRIDEAVQLLERAVKTDPGHGVCFGNLGSAYLSANRDEDAWRAFNRAIELVPKLADAHYNRAIALYRLGRLDESVASYKRSLEVQPNDARALNNLGTLLLELGQVDQSLAYVEQALKCDPQSATAHYNRALALLKLGRFPEGFEEYEWRNQAHALQIRPFTQPQWDGQPAAKTLLLHAEQGLGDTVQFVRYLPLVRAKVPHTIVEVQPSLVKLFTASGIDGVVAQGTALPPFDLHLPLPSVMRACGTAVETIPGGVPYLKADQQLVEFWSQKLAGLQGFRIGIAWQGSASYTEDRYRSIPLVHFAPLTRVRNVQLLSLQKGFGVEQIAALRRQFHVIDLAKGTDEEHGPFMDTAAIMKNLDLVITCDTVTAHLAGALGVRTWLALRSGPDWRWLLDRRDSPWYLSLVLFRQRQPGDWPQVFADMANELQRIV